MSGTMTRVAVVSAVLLAVVFTGLGADLSAGLSAGFSAEAFAKAHASAKAEAGQSLQDAAGKLSGTWVLNRELSSGFAAPGRGRARGGQQRPEALQQRPGARFATANVTMAVQRGLGGGSDASDLTPEQRAEQAAMRELQQIDSRVTITASATEVTFKNSLREQTFAINDKTATILIASSPVKVKLKWDKQTLKQEFSNTQAKLVQTWSVDASDRLVMTAKVESLTLVTPERKAVFDRQ